MSHHEQDERRGLSPPNSADPTASRPSPSGFAGGEGENPLGDCRVVLVRPHYPGNIGATARIMGNMGLDDLALVEPVADPLDPAARQMSTHSEAILHRARIVPTLAEALADRHLAVATSASTAGLYRQQAGPPDRVLAQVAAALGDGRRVAIVFGPEPTGLTNDEIAQCQGLVTIPTAETHPSLNLAQAVAICLYELRRCVEGRTPSSPGFAGDPGRGEGGQNPSPNPEFSAGSLAPLTPYPGSPAKPAGEGRKAPTLAEMERLFGHLREALEGIHFLYGDKAEPLMHALRQMLGRAHLSVGETKILHGLARQILWHRDHPRGSMQVSPDDPPLDPPPELP